MRKQVIQILTLSIILMMNIAAYSQRTNILIVYGSFLGSTKEIVDSMKRTCLQKNTTCPDLEGITDEQNTCEFHSDDMSFNDRLFDPKDIQQVRSFAQMKLYLANESMLVETMSAEKKKVELSKYDLIIIGSAIRGNAPNPQVLEFIDANRNELSKKDVVVFAVCATITSTREKKRENALTYPDKIAHGLNPIAKNVFAGNLPSTGKKFDDYMGKLFLGIETGDFRDWEKIKKWTNDIAKYEKIISE